MDVGYGVSDESGTSGQLKHDLIVSGITGAVVAVVTGAVTGAME